MKLIDRLTEAQNRVRLECLRDPQATESDKLAARRALETPPYIAPRLGNPNAPEGTLDRLTAGQIHRLNEGMQAWRTAFHGTSRDGEPLIWGFLEMCLRHCETDPQTRETLITALLAQRAPDSAPQAPARDDTAE